MLYSLFVGGTTGPTTGVLCVIFLQFIRLSLNKHIINIWNINTHLGEKCSLGAHIS